MSAFAELFIMIKLTDILVDLDTGEDLKSTVERQ